MARRKERGEGEKGLAETDKKLFITG